jgi:S-adenosylmethionine synthetase
MEWWPLVLGAGGIAVGFIVKFLAKSIANQVVSEIGDSLQVRWQADIAREIEPFDGRLHAIEKQLSPNGGDSLFDRVARIERAVSPNRFADPNGTPQGF